MSKVKVDMHTHSEYSPDSRTTLTALATAVKAARLQVVCLTDHNTIEGALRLRELADGCRVIVGEEVSTSDGEIIGLFLEKAIPRDLTAEETIARIHDQGGLVSVPHPFSRNRRFHLRRPVLERVAKDIDCIEIFNAREAFKRDNLRAAAFASENDIPPAAGSDAHRASEIGRAWVEVEDFADREDFIGALRQGSVIGELTGNYIHVITRLDVLRKWWTRRRTKTGA